MRRDVFVHPSIDAIDPKLREICERLAPVRFENCNDITERRPGDAVLSISGQADMLDALSRSHLTYFHVTERAPPPRSETDMEVVRFSNSGRLDALLRNRRLAQRKLKDFVPVAIQEGDETLAEYGGRPVWTARTGEESAGQIVSVPLPRFGADEHGLDCLNGYDFILLLPLLHFLREIAADFAWLRPKLRACLTFDDPNLHWPTYGCLSYPEIVKRAKRDRFHVAIATVPMDAWASHAGVVALFKENADQLSLLVHGNNHTREEYGQTREPENQLALVSQSLRRIERLERATNLHVDRAIVPPHEALTETAANAMLALGLEGASLAPWSLRSWNPQGRPASFGVEMADMSPEGFPCLGRYRLTENCEGPAVISALLGRPMIFVEHHNAVAQGHELLSAAAAVINSLGEVDWISLESTLRSNYLQRKEGRILRVKPYSSRIKLVVPDGVEYIELDAGQDANCTESCRLTREPKIVSQDDVMSGRPFGVTPGETFELTFPRLGTATPDRIKPAGFSFSAFGRRLACETRDRWAGYLATARARPVN